MRYEWKKLFLSPYVCLLLLATFLLNGVLFYQRCTDASQGFSQVHIREKFAQQIDLAAELEHLEQLVWTTEDTEDASLITGNIFAEQALDREVLTQQQTVESYPDFLRQRQREIAARLASNLAGDEKSYTYRGSQAVASAYHKLEGLRPQVSFSGGIQVVNDWYFTDIFLLLWAAVGALILLTQERTDGMLLILRTTRRGRGSLFLRKFAVLLAFVSVGFALFWGTDLLLSSVLLGLGDLSRPIQSVPELLGCPVPLTIIGYLLAFLAQKLLWLWTACALIALCAVLSHHAVLAAAGWGALAGVSYLLHQSHREWLESLSLVSQCMVQRRYQDCLMMNFWGIPVPRRLLFPVMSTLLFLAALGAACLYFHRCTSIAGSHFRAMLQRNTGCHVSLFRHETRKMLVTRGGVLILLTFLLLQGVIYTKPYIQARANYESYLRHYSDILEGVPNAEKSQFLHQEADRFETIQMQIADYEANVQDEGLAALLTADLRHELLWQSAFEDARAQYESLTPGQRYVHPSGWLRLYGQEGRQDFFVSLLFFGTFLAISLSGTFSSETETGVAVLQATAGTGRAVRRRKIVLSAILMLLLALVAFLPEYAAVAHTFGLSQLAAPAASLSFFRTAPPTMCLWHILIISAVIRLVWSAAALAVVLGISAKTRNTIVTLLFSLALLLLPPLVLLLL